MKKKNAPEDLDALSLPRPSSSDLRGKQSVRATFRLTSRAIEAISVRHGEIRIPLVPSAEPLRVEAQHFVDCVREGRTPRSDGRSGLRVVNVLEAAGESLKQDGAPVRIADL